MLNLKQRNSKQMPKMLILTALLFVAASTTFGQSIQRLGPNYFVAGVPSDEFDFWAAESVYGNQRQENWCWAACSQMVLNYHGLYVSQEQIVTRIFGNLVDSPANEYQIKTALSGWAPNVSGTVSNIYCQSGLTSINEITQALAYKWPLIAGLRNTAGNVGHAYVLTAIYYSVDMYNNTIPDKVVLRDPMPGNDGRIEVSWYEFSRRLDMIFKVWVSR